MKFKKKYIILFLLLVEIFVLYTQAFAINPNLTGLDEAGNSILYVLKRIGYWVILAKCIMEILSSVVQKDIHTLGKTIMTYVCIYAALYFVPWAMRLVEGIF